MAKNHDRNAWRALRRADRKESAAGAFLEVLFLGSITR